MCRTSWIGWIGGVCAAALWAQTPTTISFGTTPIAFIAGKITTGPDGALWYTTSDSTGKSATISRITTLGVGTSFQIPTASPVLAGITAGPDGALWFTELQANTIGRCTTTGDITEFPLPAKTLPAGITLGPDGALWFAEYSNNKIGRITTAGAISEFPIPQPVAFPLDIIAGPDGALWFTESNRIGRITTSGVITEFPLPGAPAPHGIAAGPDGALWFGVNFGIGRITTAGAATILPLGLSVLEIVLGQDGALWFTNNQATLGRITTNGGVNLYNVPGASLTLGPDGAFWLTNETSIFRAFPAPVLNEFTIPTANSGPNDIAAGPDGALWFTEYLRDKVGRITTGGAITEFPVTAASSPLSIAAGPDNGLWFTEYAGNRIGRIDATSHQVTEKAIPTTNSGPSFIAAGPDGALWFSEAISNKIGRITTAGSVSNEFPIPTANGFPQGVAAGSDGAIWFAEHAGKIGRVTTAGSITEFPVPTANGIPYGISAGPDGALWFTELSAGKLGRIATNGAVTEIGNPDSNGPGGITTGPDGAIWYTQGTAGKIGRYTPGGFIDVFPLASNAAPQDIATGPDGALWFTESGVNRIGRMTMGGCMYVITPNPVNVSGGGSSGAFAVATTAGCPWQVSSTTPWIFPTTLAGIGNGNATFNVSPNTDSVPRTGSIIIAGRSFAVIQAVSVPVLSISKTHTGNFSLSQPGATYTVTVANNGPAPTSGSLTVSESVPSGMSLVSMAGTGWSCSATACTRGDALASGASYPTITVTVNIAGNAPSLVSNKVSIFGGGSASASATDVATITGAANLPFGSFDTPANNTTSVVGAIGVTGWALANTVISKVEIYRDPVGAEAGGNFGLVFIGNATFVTGARPDVQAQYPNLPNANKAGWGYLLLTNFLPDDNGSGPGNGSYRLHAIAYNAAGNPVELGAPGRTIVCDNAHATKPFGTIDTPGQGDTASGANFINFGWALTPGAGFKIPVDGSTITVTVDGVSLGHATYNQFRNDIAAAFPGYTNSGGAVGYFFLDTTKLTAGVHTIGWLVYDDHGRGEGIGSRFFTVANGPVNLPEEPTTAAFDDSREVRIRKNLETEAAEFQPDREGWYDVTIGELGRVEVHAAITGGEGLPIGSTVKDGTFYWQLGPGFLGEYRLMLMRGDGRPVPVRIRVKPKTFAAVQ